MSACGAVRHVDAGSRPNLRWVLISSPNMRDLLAIVSMGKEMYVLAVAKPIIHMTGC